MALLKAGLAAVGSQAHIYGLAAVLSFFIGVSLGLLGGGGSILTVPILVYVLGVDPKEAIATSLIVVGFTSAAGMIAHARAGNVNWRMGIIFGLAGMAGAFGGGLLAGFLSGRTLLVLFALMTVATAAAMLYRQDDRDGKVLAPKWAQAPNDDQEACSAVASPTATKSPSAEETETSPTATPEVAGRAADEAEECPECLATAGEATEAPPDGHGSEDHPLWRIIADGLVVGAITGLVGAGGGFLVVPALVLLAGLEMRSALGTSLLVISMKSFAGYLGHARHAHIDWSMAGLVSIVAVLGSFAGSFWAKYVPQAVLRQGFAVFVLVVGLAQLTKELLAH